MKVFKFGGASVKNAESIRNVAGILSLYKGEKLAVVVSAMDKNTNAFEEITKALMEKNKTEFISLIEERIKFHKTILDELINDENNPIYGKINSLFLELKERINHPKERPSAYYYSGIVSLGEVLSTKIINAYLIQEGFNSVWKNAASLIRTENKYKDANVDWDVTKKLFNERFVPEFKSADILLTQGFIGHNDQDHTTTLGREGSDFTAGIIAHCCDSKSVTIWKDVPGMLNADPKWFDNTIKLDSISFREAIELSYYGASVIHPKTIKPLQNKDIPLFVKSFINPKEAGTTIHSCTSQDHLVPSFIFKQHQLLVSISPKDFSFIGEGNLSDIFGRLSSLDIKLNLMQNSALSFSILIDENKVDIEEFISTFNDLYDIKYNSNLELITIRHYDDETIERCLVNKQVLLQQITRETARIIVANN